MKRATLLCCSFAFVVADPVVQGSLGNITGKIDKIYDVETEAFLGIPFAKPPVEQLRFALPQPYGPVGDLQAIKYAPACPQHPMYGMTGGSEEEDCLFLNVFRKPGTTKNDRKAVIAVVHGGAYRAGSASNVPQSAENLASVGDVIIVSFNYRLGIFGFADMKGLAPGNLGLYDQRLALQWITDNIADFGGDSARVTIMGLSAGSMSVAAQILTTIDKKNPFQAAVMDAGVVASSGFLEDPESSFARTKKVAKEVGCSDEFDKMLECLRNVSVGALLSTSATQSGTNGILNFVPTADGIFLPLDVEKYLEEGPAELRRIRTIIGYVHDEGSMFVSLGGGKFNFSAAKTRDEILDYCMRISGMYNFPIDVKNAAIREKVGQLFVDANSGIAGKAIASFISDGIFHCPINRFIESYSRHNDKVFAYRFDRKLSRTYFKRFNPKILGAFHFSPYLHFSGALYFDEEIIAEADKQFSLDAMNVVSNFAKSDSPLTFRGTEWPSFAKTGAFLVFDETPSVMTGLVRKQTCQDLLSAPSG